MIDTIRFYQNWEIKKAAFPSDWKGTSHQKRLSDGNRVVEGTIKSTFANQKFGIRLWCEGSKIYFIQATLPKLLFGHNGKVIKTQTELNSAFARLDEIISQIAKPVSHDRKFTRVDLVWQFKGNPKTYFLSHENCSHPEIRSAIEHRIGESLRWRGSEIQIRIYDKCKELSGTSGNIIRVEIQLSKRKLVEHLGNGYEKVSKLSFSDCYRTYRKILLRFQTKRVPSCDSTTALIFAADRLRRKNTPSIFGIWARKKDLKYVNRIKKELSAIHLKYFRINWRKKLPQNGYPLVVEIEPKSHKNDRRQHFVTL